MGSYFSMLLTSFPPCDATRLDFESKAISDGNGKHEVFYAWLQTLANRIATRVFRCFRNVDRTNAKALTWLKYGVALWMYHRHNNGGRGGGGNGGSGSMLQPFCSTTMTRAEAVASIIWSCVIACSTTVLAMQTVHIIATELRQAKASRVSDTLSPATRTLLSDARVVTPLTITIFDNEREGN